MKPLSPGIVFRPRLADYSAMDFRDATFDDLAALVGMLAQDPLGAARERYETPLPDCYNQAFADIQNDPNSRIIIAENDQGIAGFLQITMIPNLSHQGVRRALIEGVRVAEHLRGTGVGQTLFEHAIELAREGGCGMVQLTTDKSRPDALAFYEKLGFVHSHAGMKLKF